MIRVYLCGPIGGVSPKEALSWRHYARDYLLDNGIIVLDPTQGKDVTRKDYNAAQIVEADLKMVEECNILLYDGSRDVVQYGSPMEIFYASRILNKTVYTWSMKYADSFWLEHFTTEFFETLDDALEKIVLNYSRVNTP